MKMVVSTVLLLFLPPIHATVLSTVSPFGLRPDIVLVAVCLVGLWAGQTRGCLAGALLGFVQDLFSAGTLWLHLLTKAGFGFLSGVVARYISTVPVQAVFIPVAVFSFGAGMVFLLSSRPDAGMGAVSYGFATILLPQVLLDGLAAVGANWVVVRWAVKAPNE